MFHPEIFLPLTFCQRSGVFAQFPLGNSLKICMQRGVLTCGFKYNGRFHTVNCKAFQKTCARLSFDCVSSLLGDSAFLQFVFSCILYFFTTPLFSAVCPFAQKFAVVCPIALCDGAHLQFLPYRPASEGGCTEYFWQNVKKYCWKILICVTINMLWEE